jgi:predicted MPP superfamily phosphohydrolase
MPWGKRRLLIVSALVWSAWPDGWDSSMASVPDSSELAGHGVRVPARRHGTLRRALSWIAEHSFVAIGGRWLYRSRHLAAGRFVERFETVLVPGLDPALEGLTIAQLSDLHAGAFLGSGDLSAVVAAVARRCPDMVVITGDMIAHHWEESLTVLDDLAQLQSPLGTYAVFGNHDYRGRNEGRIAEAYAERGIRFLRNECERFEMGNGVLALVGLEDLEEAKDVDLDKARGPVQVGDVEIVLCHNPRGAAAIAGAGCTAILSGHTHGTQVDLPVLRRLGPQHPGLRLDLGTTTLIVSRGLGVVAVPMRVGVPAEVVYLQLKGCSPL